MPDKDRLIDTTHLSIDQATDRGFIHQDYIAHCMRWSFVVNRLMKGSRYKTSRVLDVGCGIDLPLAKLLYSSKMIVDKYVGLDYNSVDRLKLGPFHTGKFPVRAFGGVDFASDQVKVFAGGDDVAECLLPDGTDDPHVTVMDKVIPLPNVITCFEMLEHVRPEHAVRTLRKFKAIMQLSKPGVAEAFVSTPCYSAEQGHAQNHVNEMTHLALGSVMENLGFAVIENYGTFANQRDYRDTLFRDYPGTEKLWKELKGYYTSSYIATMFAPLYPALARNNHWVLSTKTDGYVRKFPPLVDVPTPWGSSEYVADLLKSEEP